MNRFAVAATAALALALAPKAWAHASISPPVAQTKTLQQFTLDVQAEQEDARTTSVDARFPDGFDVETFAASPGWARQPVTAGKGEEQHVVRVVWTGGEDSPRDDPLFRFTGTLQSAETFGVQVRQTYSDGSVENWDGPKDDEAPAAYVKGVTSLGAS